MRLVRATHKRRLNAGLARIRNKSGLYANGWRYEEAALLWAVYVQAVLDHFSGKDGPRPMTGEDRITARYTAETGAIVMPSGRQQNILELLQIDPDWAFRQIKTAIGYVEGIAA